jgi:hypothetical protein
MSFKTVETGIVDKFVHTPTLFALLKKEYNLDETKDVLKINTNTIKQSSYFFVKEAIARLNENAILYMSAGLLDGNLTSETIKYDFENKYELVKNVKLYYAPNAADEVDKIGKILSQCYVSKVQERSLHVVCKQMCNKSFFTMTTKIKMPKISDLALHYGEGFLEVHEKIISGLTKKDGSGIVLLYGEPGTGKTHYIRYLIQEIKKKKLIYIPPDLASDISSPEFLPFMIKNCDSILIIEDAENVIRDRLDSGQKNQAVANLLNLSDGLLGDSLRQPIIATFNCEISKIDSALLRNGRLIANHEFKKLPVDNAQKLSDRLGLKKEILEPMTLADIYAMIKED